MSSPRVLTLFCVLFISGCDPELRVSDISSDGSLADIDNDGIVDASDAFPLDGSETLDTDLVTVLIATTMAMPMPMPTVMKRQVTQ